MPFTSVGNCKSVPCRKAKIHWQAGLCLLSGLTEVQLRPALPFVPQEAFRATNAKTIVLPEGVERIESGAFESCKATAITVPGTVKYIGKRALYSVLLRDVNFNCLSPVREDQVLYSSNRLVVQCYLALPRTSTPRPIRSRWN